jgi:hypothetical protein
VSGLRGSLRLQSGDTVTLWWRGGYSQRRCTVFPGTQLLLHIPVRAS